MIDYQKLQDPLYLKSLSDAQGKKCYLYQVPDYSTTPIVKLFIGSQNGKWIYTKIFGVLCYVLDRDKKCQYLKIHDINSLQLLFQSELYHNFKQSYQKISEHFYYYELEKGYIGFSFEDSKQANQMNQLIQQNSEILKIDDKDLKKYLQTQNKRLGLEKKSGIGSLFSSYVSDVSNYFSGGKQKVDGQVQSSQHISGIKWDSTNNCISTEYLPQEIKEQFKAANIKKSDLKNPETAEMIYRLVIEHYLHLVQKEKEQKEKDLMQPVVKDEKKQPVQKEPVQKASELKGPKLPVDLNKTQKSARANLLDEIRKPNIDKLKKVDEVVEKPKDPRNAMLDQIKNQKEIHLKKPEQEQKVTIQPPKEKTLAEKLKEQMDKRRAEMQKNYSDDPESDFSN